MSVWVDPNLLSLVGVGLSADADAPDGRHLRWFFGAPLGFPRSGFRLRRHVSKIASVWDSPAAPDPLILAQFLTLADLGPGSDHRFDSGLTVGKVGGLAYSLATTSNPTLRLDSQPVTLEFGRTGSGAPPPPGPNLSNPAAFVRLTITRRRRTGYAVASASYDARGAYRIQDRGGVGTERTGWFPPDLGAVTVATADGLRLRSAAEQPLDGALHAASERATVAALARVTRPPDTLAGRLARAVDSNPWLTETILLRGSSIDRVEITGSDAVLIRVQWILVRNYASAPGWVDVERFFLPLTDTPDLYPAWTTASAAQIVKQRLLLAPPKRNLPWDDATRPVPDNLDARYRGETFAAIDEAMRLFLKGQITSLLPQEQVEVSQALAASDGDTSESMIVKVRPFEHVYAAAADPQIARLLGLMTTDSVDPAGVYDYMVDMNVPPLWLRWALFPDAAREESAQLRAAGVNGGDGLSQHERADTCVALATCVAAAPSTTPDPVEDLRVQVEGDVSATPVQARVELSWRSDPRTFFDNQGSSRVFYSATRSVGGHAVSLHHRDEGSGLLMPHVPTQRQPPDGRLRLVDRSIPAWGSYTWLLRGMDLWGRFSPPASIAAEVRDTIAPPAPTSIECVLEGDASAAPHWAAALVSFDWSLSQVALAPDLDRFEVHLRQGEIARAAAGDPATWGVFEYAAGVTSPPVVVRWPSLALDSLPTGIAGSVSTTAIPPEEGGGWRIAVRLGPMQSVVGTDERTVVSATLRAIDQFDNKSGFGTHAQATRFVEVQAAPPPVADELAFASNPDALGRAAYRIEWPDLGAGRVRVLRAVGRALLAAAETDMGQYDALDRHEQAAFLRGLALANQQPFAADHEFPYPARAGFHLAYLNANERGLTVFTIETTSSAEVRAAWPSDPRQFLVVAVQPKYPPAIPLAREVRSGDRRVAIHVAPDLIGDVARLRLYRTRVAADLVDLRHMRLVNTVSVFTTTDEVTLGDDGLYPDVDYWYRVVALAADGRQSQPSAPLLARPYSSLPPPAPVIAEVIREGSTGTRRVTCVVVRRDLPLTLSRRRKGDLTWRVATGTHIGADGRVDVLALSPEPVPSGYRFTIADDVTAAANERYLYRLRVRDVQGRTSDSDAVEETP